MLFASCSFPLEEKREIPPSAESNYGDCRYRWLYEQQQAVPHSRCASPEESEVLLKNYDDRWKDYPLSYQEDVIALLKEIGQKLFGNPFPANTVQRDCSGHRSGICGFVVSVQRADR